MGERVPTPAELVARVVRFVGEPAEGGSDQRPERGTQIAQERRERPMGIEQKTGRNGKPATLQLVGQATSGPIAHVTGTAASASISACASRA